MSWVPYALQCYSFNCKLAGKIVKDLEGDFKKKKKITECSVQCIFSELSPLVFCLIELFYNSVNCRKPVIMKRILVHRIAKSVVYLVEGTALWMNYFFLLIVHMTFLICISIYVHRIFRIFIHLFGYAGSNFAAYGIF